MKSKLLPALLLVLLILNGVLIFMLINTPHEKRNQHPEKHFLTQELGFSESQKNQFEKLDEIHRQNMTEIHHQIRKQKDLLFNSFHKNTSFTDNLTNQIGVLQSKKESELFRFFKEVRVLCKGEQVNMFDEIIQKAMQGGKPRPPREGMPPPPREGLQHPPREEMPPPR